MKNVGSKVTKWATGIAIALLGLLGSARDARADDLVCKTYPMVNKNLRSYTSCTGPHQLTKREVKHLAASAKSAADHLKLAHYYEGEADWMDAQGAVYEEAAARYRNSPSPKNLMSPSTVPHYEYLARGFSEEAKSDRALAASQEQMAKNAGTPAESQASGSVTQ